MSKHSAYLWLPLLLWSAACGAHPHSWIDMVSQLQINRDGQLTELRLAWLFDEFYSASILDDAKANGRSPEQELAIFAKETIANLATENYLNRMNWHGQKIRFSKPVTNYQVRMVQGQIRLDYTLPLPTPLPLDEQGLTFGIYDSTYYVEMLHKQPEAIQLQGEGAHLCQRQLVPPNPSAEQQAYAISLDKTQQAEEGLGTAFAEQVLISCHRQQDKLDAKPAP